MITLIEQQKKMIGMGNSGCTIELIQGDPLIVKKTALSTYTDRLNNQRIKQQNFSCPISNIRIPRILSFDQHSFTMELLPMLDAIEFFERSEPKTIQARLNILIDFVRWEIKHSNAILIDEILFHEKLSTIKSLVATDVWESYYASYEEKFVHYLPSQMQFPIGNCHGDLTLSNIMFSIRENQIGMIDFLDSFINSPLVDLAKLLQDVRFNWSSHRFPLPHDRGKIRIINSWLYRLLQQEFSKEINTPPFLVIQMMNYFRIIPYVRSQADHRYLTNVLAQISL